MLQGRKCRTTRKGLHESAPQATRFCRCDCHAGKHPALPHLSPFDRSEVLNFRISDSCFTTRALVSPYNGTNGCDAELSLQLEPVGPIPRELPVPGILQKDLGQALPVRGSETNGERTWIPRPSSLSLL